MFVPKMLDKPAELSLGEYNSLEATLMGFWTGLKDEKMSTIVTALAECRIQASMCPALRDYTGDN